MKRLLVTVPFLLTYYVHGQDINVTELIEVIECDDFDCFNDIATNNHYSFGETREDDDRVAYLYNSDKYVEATSNPQVTLQSSLSIFDKGDRIFVMHSSGNKDDYVRWIKELKEIGFMKTGTDPYNGGIVEYYTDVQKQRYMVKVVTKTRNDGFSDYKNYSLLVQHNG